MTFRPSSYGFSTTQAERWLNRAVLVLAVVVVGLIVWLLS